MNLELLISKLISLAMELVYSIMIVIACYICIKVSLKAINKVFTSKVATHVNQGKLITLNSVINSTVKYAIIFIGVCTVLVTWGVDPTSLVAILGTGTVAIGLGAQNVIKDIIGGFFILLENQFEVGDIVEIESKTGIIEEIAMRTTSIRDFDGTLHIIPNGNITIVSNKCKEFMNAIIDVDVAYEENLEHVISILNSEMDIAIKEIPQLIDRPTVLGAISLGDSGITIRTVAKCSIKENYGVEREIRTRIKNRFDLENITIPFPQCVIHNPNSKEA